MTDLSNWTHYKNIEGDLQGEYEWVRANLVYTPYISPDGQVFCMSFNRDIKYHIFQDENEKWTEELLENRFRKELEFHDKASKTLPTLDVLDVDYQNRKIFLKWHGDDFYMQGLKSGGYENVLPDWKDQWINLIKGMWDLGIYKISLHPNSWVVRDGLLVPFNWFFCYNKTDPSITVRSLLIQISSDRQEKLSGVDIDKLYTPVEAQYIAFNSFKSNYPADLIENILTAYRNRNYND